MNTLGNLFRISIFGESHGDCIGCTIDGLPAGFEPEWTLVNDELKLRMPRKSYESTSRYEADSYKIISGYYNGHCSGMPLTVLFPNLDARSKDYNNLARPCHADFAANKKFHGYNDIRGGGAFSGRLTVALVFAGSLAKQLLNKYGIKLASHVQQIGHAVDSCFDPIMRDFPPLDRYFPLIDSSAKSDFEAELTNARNDGDSIGAIVEAAALNLPIGLGEPFFDSLESCMAHILFSIPGVRGIEFGKGFEIAASRGSEINDQFMLGGKTSTNFSGGINGGLSNGMPLIFRICFRPIPSISIAQSLLNTQTGAIVLHKIQGRHDACIVPRGCVIIEACAAIAIYDLLLRFKLNGGCGDD